MKTRFALLSTRGPPSRAISRFDQGLSPAKTFDWVIGCSQAGIDPQESFGPALCQRQLLKLSCLSSRTSRVANARPPLTSSTSGSGRSAMTGSIDVEFVLTTPERPGAFEEQTFNSFKLTAAATRGAERANKRSLLTVRLSVVSHARRRKTGIAPQALVWRQERTQKLRSR